MELGRRRGAVRMVVEMGNGASLTITTSTTSQLDLSAHYALLVIRRNQVLPRRRVECKPSPTIRGRWLGRPRIASLWPSALGDLNVLVVAYL